MGRRLSSIDITPMDLDDESGVVDLWNRALGERFPLRPRLLHQTTLADPDLQADEVLLARQKGRVVGFALARTWPPRGSTSDPMGAANRAPLGGPGSIQGWLEAVVVDPRRQRQGVGSALAEEAEARLAAKGAQAIWAAGGPAMLFPGVCTDLAPALRFFEGRGYVWAQQVHDLIGNLDAITRPPQVDRALAAAMAEVRPCAEAERDAAQEFLEEHFPGVWPRDRQRHRAMGAPAHEIYLLWTGNRIAGLAQTYYADSPVLGPNVYWAPTLGVAEGGLGPIGLAEDWRGRGLGLALLTLALEGVRARGVHRLVIDWTQLLGFYGILGFQVWRSYMLGCKILGGGA